MQNRPMKPGIECLRKQTIMPISVCQRCMYHVRFDHDSNGLICNVVCSWQKDMKGKQQQPMLTGLLPDDKQPEELINDTPDGR